MEERSRIPVTVQLLLEKDNKILFMKRENTGYADGKYGLPGGHVEKNEEIKEAMIREAKEEIGIDIKSNDLILYKVLNRKISEDNEYIDFIFKTNKWSRKIQNCEVNKCEKIEWIDKERIPKDFRGDIVVHGDIDLVGDWNILCSLWVLGYVNSYEINVAGDLYCGGDVASNAIDVGGGFIASKINAHNNAINAKSLKCRYIEKAIIIKIGC